MSGFRGSAGADRSSRLQRGDAVRLGRLGAAVGARLGRRGDRRWHARPAQHQPEHRPAPSAPRPAVRRAASRAPAVWLRSAAQTPFRGRRARTGCWQIPRGPRAAAPPRQVRRPGSTSTTRSRRTENESRGAWTGEFRLRGMSAKAFEHRERGDHRTGRVRDAADTASAQRIRLIREYRNGFRGAC